MATDKLVAVELTIKCGVKKNAKDEGLTKQAADMLGAEPGMVGVSFKILPPDVKTRLAAANKIVPEIFNRLTLPGVDGERVVKESCFQALQDEIEAGALKAAGAYAEEAAQIAGWLPGLKRSLGNAADVLVLPTAADFTYTVSVGKKDAGKIADGLVTTNSDATRAAKSKAAWLEGAFAELTGLLDSGKTVDIAKFVKNVEDAARIGLIGKDKAEEIVRLAKGMASAPKGMAKEKAKARTVTALGAEETEPETPPQDNEGEGEAPAVLESEEAKSLDAIKLI